MSTLKIGSGVVVLLIFILCAVADFAWGYLHNHSVAQPRALRYLV